LRVDDGDDALLGGEGPRGVVRVFI